MTTMKTGTRAFALLGALTASISACAVETAHASPSPSGPASTSVAPVAAPSAEHAAPERITRCLVEPIYSGGNPLACASAPAGVTTIAGGITTSTDASYAQSCGAMAVVDFDSPDCGDVTSAIGWAVSPTSISSLSAASCPGAYLDYTVSVFSRNAQAWKSTGARVYGVFIDGSCFLEAANAQENPASDVEMMEVAADAYAPSFVSATGGGFTQVSLPVGLSFYVRGNL